MLSREQRIKQAQDRITAKALAAAENVAAHWGVPVGEACVALEAAAMKLRGNVAAGKPWPAESQRLVSNGTPDAVVLAKIQEVKTSPNPPPTTEAMTRRLRGEGVRRRRADLLGLLGKNYVAP